MVITNRKLTIFTGCIFLMFLTSAGVAGTCSFSCCLAGIANDTQQVDTKAKGNVVFSLDESKQELKYKLEVENISDVYMAHVHIGPEDKQGPIAVWLYPPRDVESEKRCLEGSFSGTLAEGVIRPEDLKKGLTFGQLIEAMRTGNAYVNVHTKKNKPGEIQGQISPEI